MKIQILAAELERDGKIQHVKVRAIVKPLMVESETIVADYVVEKRLGFAPGQRAEDGEYTLTCILRGERQPPERVQVVGGQLEWLKL